MAAPTNSDAGTTPSRAGVVSDACSASTFGDRLRKAMDQHGMSQVEFAEKANVTPMEINHWIHGRRTPCVNNLAKLVRALKHTRLDWLILGENL